MLKKVQALFRNRRKTKSLPKKRQQASVFLVSEVDCIVCGAKNIEITEQGLCESCGNITI